MKEMFIDVETTGVDPVKNSIVQLAGIYYRDGEEHSEFNLDIAPASGDHISPAALKVTGLNEEEIKRFPHQSTVYSWFTSYLDKQVDKFNKRDKIFFIAYNARFDMDFLRQFFIRNGNKFFGSYFFFPPIDIMNLAAIVLQPARAVMKDFKLSTVAEELGIEFGKEDLHDALVDIKLSRKVYLKCLEIMKGDRK